MDREMSEHVLKLVEEQIAWLNETVSPLIASMNPEGKRVQKKDWPAIAAYMLTLYPPQDFVFPDGHVEHGSAWGLALQHVPGIKGGRELARQIERGLNG